MLYEFTAKNPMAKGSIMINFEVEPKGKIQNIDIQSYQVSDETFNKCLTEVLKRIQFRTFDGPAISAVFPLRFE